MIFLVSFQLDDEEAKKKEQQIEEMLDPDDEFFKEYRARLMQQMQERLLNSLVSRTISLLPFLSFDDVSENDLVKRLI